MISEVGKKCIGCKTCKVICPANAIKIIRDEEGFEYPLVLEDKCIKCEKCLKFCPTLHKSKNIDSGVKSVLAVRNKNQKVLMQSSSGGIFSVLASYVIKKNGIVYGVAFDEAFQVVYIRGDKDSDIVRMRGSKYVDAYISEEVIKEFENDVKSNRRVLFSGTSCQIAGMKEICRAKDLNDENVIYVDFYICSGKVSSLLWRDECKSYRKKGRIEEISFRSKKNGWKTYQMYQRIDGKLYYKDFLLTRWSKILGNDSCIRSSCINCKYSCGRSGADISMGDLWKCKEIPRSWNDNKGISIIKINTDRGADLFASNKSKMEYQKIEFFYEEKLCNDTKKRKEFWKIYHEFGYEVVCDKYARITLKDKLLLGVVRHALVKLKII